MGLISALGLVSYPSRVLSKLFDRNTFFSRIPVSAFSNLNQLETLPVNQQGRIADPYAYVYDTATFTGKIVNRYWKDWVVPITGVTIGKTEDSFNLVWYKIADEGYAHSGGIQPVSTITNHVLTEIPPDGVLGEVTVPYTDARKEPGSDKQVDYRFYYATTYWIIGIDQDEYGNPWYLIRDDKWEDRYYVPAQHLRIIPREELKPISPDVPQHMKRIEVHIPEQVMVAYEYDQPVFMARIASGAIFRDGDYSTPPGQYMTFHKRASRHMARGNLAANSYDLPGVPWNSYITEEGIAFHGTYWHNNFGKPRSHGCLNLTPQAAKWVYLWTNPQAPPEIDDVFETSGTIVDIIG